MFAIITGMYITITGKICHYYEECISYLQVIFAVITKCLLQLQVKFATITGMYIVITGNICRCCKNVYYNHILFLQVIFAVFTKNCLSHLKS